MNPHSRKVLEAEKKRTGVGKTYMLPGDGYLKADQAFPSSTLMRSPQSAHRTGASHSPNGRSDAKDTTNSDSGTRHHSQRDSHHTSHHRRQQRQRQRDLREGKSGSGSGSGSEYVRRKGPYPHEDPFSVRRSRKHPLTASSSATASPQPKRDRIEQSRSPRSLTSAQYAAPPVAARLRELEQSSAVRLTPVKTTSRADTAAAAATAAAYRRYTNLQSPPLRAAVSPRPISLSPRSTASTTPTSMPFVPDRHGLSWPALPPASAPAPWTGTHRSLPGAPSVGKLVSPHRAERRRSPYRYGGELSGFVNPGCDCYACSVLTLLLRSAVFARALQNARNKGMWTEEGGEEAKRNKQREAEDDDGPGYYLDSLTRTHVYRDQLQQKTIHEILYGFSRRLERPETIQDGLDMSPLRGFFPCNFFTGDQEDAHEFFVVLMAKLEEEARKVMKSQELLRWPNVKHTEEDNTDNEADQLFRDCYEGPSDEGSKEENSSEFAGKGEEEDDENEDEDKVRRNSWNDINFNDRTTATGASTIAHVSATATTTAIEGHLATTASTSDLIDPIEPSRIWINALIQGKLLNIIRCRNEKCGHEIVTEEPYVNLSVNLLKPSRGDSPSSVSRASLPLHTMEDGQDMNAVRSSVGAHTPPPQPLPLLDGTPLSPQTAHEEHCHDVQSLLENSLRFSPLDAYVCDACGSSRHQHQGGCLSGTAPPILVIQVNRFASRYDAATRTVVVSKDKTPIRVNDELTLYSLCCDGQYDRDNKKLTTVVRSAERLAQRTGAPACVKATRSRYRLQGVVLHLGSTLYAGHYVAEFALDPSQRNSSTVARDVVNGEENIPMRTWKIADDSVVSNLSNESVLKRRAHSSNCYLLLYEKIANEEIMAPIWRVLPREAELSIGPDDNEETCELNTEGIP